jgi:hypothetical protein
MKILVASCFIASSAILLARNVSAAEPERQLDEIVVSASTLKAADLRKRLVEKEDAFYAAYNDLNKNDDFDVNCREETKTGTRLSRRTCRAGFEDNAIAREAYSAFLIRQDMQNQLARGSSAPKLLASPPSPAASEIEAKRPEFQVNMRSVVRANPMLQRLLQERAVLMQQYLELKKRVPQNEQERSEPPDIP